MKHIAIVIICLFGLSGCQTLQNVAEKALPSGQAQVDGTVVSVDIPVLFGAVNVCLTEDGSVTSLLRKIPTVGDMLVEAIGVCPPVTE
jgi:hypothetical protein